MFIAINSSGDLRAESEQILALKQSGVSNCEKVPSDVVTRLDQAEAKKETLKLSAQLFLSCRIWRLRFLARRRRLVLQSATGGFTDSFTIRSAAGSTAKQSRRWCIFTGTLPYQTTY